MKPTKRLLAILLAVLLGLAVLAPMASAAGDPAYAPIITKQPKEQVTIFTGKDLVLEVEAKLPDGAPGTLSYEWYRDDYGVVGTNAKLVYPVKDDRTDNYYGMKYYFSRPFYAVVTNTYTDEKGEVQTVLIESSVSYVTIVNNFDGFLPWWLNGISNIPYELITTSFGLILFPITFPLEIYWKVFQPIFEYIGFFVASLA